MLCEGDAAVYLDSSNQSGPYSTAPRMAKAPNGLGPRGTVTPERFPAQLLDDQHPSLDVRELRQQKGESLAAYFSRAQTLMTRLGCRDLPRETSSV